MGRALRVRFYPSRLSDNDLDELQAMVLRSFDQAPQFSYWLVEALQGEQVRRLEDKPVARFGIPVGWPGAMLAQAITVLTALTYHPPSYAAGQFADSLLLSVNAVATTKLEQVR